MDKTIYTQSIVHRLILYILLSSLLISLLITIFQLFLDYSREMARIKAHMQQAKEFFLQTLPNNSENISHLKFRVSLKKLLQPPDIMYLEVRSNGKTLDFAGNFQSEKTTSALFPIMYKHEDKNIKTGELLVIASLKPVYQRLEDKVWIILGSNAINTLLISVLIFFLFQFLVTRHLVRISQHTHVITPNHLDTSLILERKTKHDELQQVVEAINGMKINLRNSYKKINQERIFSQSIITAIPSALVTLDRKGRILTFNPNFLLTFGEKDFIGIKLTELVPSAGIEEAIDRVILKGEEMFNLEVCHDIGSEKETQIFKVYVARINFEGTQEIDDARVLAVFDNITDRRQAEAERIKAVKATAEIVEAMTDGVATAGLDMKITEVNRALANMFGYEKEELVGKSLKELHAEKDREIIKKHIMEYIEKGVSSDISVYTAVSRKGKRFPVQINVSMKKDDNDKPIDIITVIRDITELKKVESELIQARKAAEASSAAKSEFLTNMSHEIRTPLNSIVGFSQILLNKTKNIPLPKEFQNYLKNIQTSGQNLSELINNILDLSKIEAGKMELSVEPLNIRTLIQSIYHINKAQALQKGISFQYDIDSGLPDIISSDRTKLNQILMNLTGNAIKFTPSGKEIRIRATKDDNQILFKVIDQGIGIPRDRQENIFGLFEQVDSTITRKFGGTGLGLAITKKMVMLLNGEIWLRSAPGEGSVFFARIPLLIPPEQPIEQDEMHLRDFCFLKDNRVLLVEDNPMNQDMVQALFHEMGLEIDLAGNGQEGIERALALKPDLVLMDMHMPGMDGITATMYIRSHPEGADIPIVALSADAFTEQQCIAKSAGVEEYLTKPLNFQKLYPVLARHLRHDPNYIPETDKKQAETALPEPVVKQLRGEFETLSEMPFFDAAALTDQTAKMTAMCKNCDSSYLQILKKIDDAIFASDEGQFYLLIRDVLDESG
ncbi:MAG: PAS domain S-box protein [Desulfobacterales bacterium]|nr:PAS domain S-box protein [Desulfobacterales bacterium]